MSRNRLNNSAIPALLAFELQRGMEYPVFLQPFFDLVYHLLVLIEIRIAGIQMRIEDGNVRTETPDMHRVHTLNPAHGGSLTRFLRVADSVMAGLKKAGAG